MSTVKNILLKVPIIGRPLINMIWSVKKLQKFRGSANYWETLYQVGGNSGEGSYNRLAQFKADIINEFLKVNPIKQAMEFGCGDGNQLALINYPVYIGLDISPTIIIKNIQKFKTDNTKSFFVYNSIAFKDNAGVFKADLCLSLDVIFHLIEDEIYEKYMQDLFQASTKYVIIYSSNYDSSQNFHERDHNFLNWIKNNRMDWKLDKVIENKYKYDKSDPENTSKADFYFFSKNNSI